MSDPIFAVSDAVLDDLLARQQNTQWPSAVEGQGWARGTGAELPTGGHFTAWEEPETFARELTALAQECGRC